MKKIGALERDDMPSRLRRKGLDIMAPQRHLCIERTFVARVWSQSNKSELLPRCKAEGKRAVPEQTTVQPGKSRLLTMTACSYKRKKTLFTGYLRSDFRKRKFFFRSQNCNIPPLLSPAPKNWFIELKMPWAGYGKLRGYLDQGFDVTTVSLQPLYETR